MPADQTLTVHCFDEPGPQNTEATLAAALARARQLSLQIAVVASDSGKTARRALAVLAPELRVVVVTMPLGLQLPVQKLHDYLPRFREHREALIASGVTKVGASLSEEVVAELTAAGAKVHRVDWRAIGPYTGPIGALDRIGVGVRVAVTITVCAQLAGSVAAGEDVLAIAGTGFGGGGADSAAVIRTGATFRDWRVLEVVARPRISPPSE